MASAWNWLRASKLRLAGVALLAILLLVRLALPLMIVQLGEYFGTKELGRIVRIGDVDLSVFTGGLVVEQVQIGPIGDQGAPPPEFSEEDARFRLERGEVQWKWLPLLRRELHIEKVDLQNPEGALFRDVDGDLIPVLRPQPGAEEDEPDDESEPWPVQLDELRIAGFKLLYINLALPEQTPLQLDVEEFRLADLVVADQAIKLQKVGLHGPTLRIRRDIDLAVLQAAPEQEAGDDGPAEPDPSGELLDYDLEEVALDRALFTIVSADGAEIETRLTIDASQVTGARETSFPLKALLELGEGSLTVEAKVGISPPTFDGAITWTDLPLDVLASMAADAVPVQVDSGSATGALQVDVAIAERPEDPPSTINASGKLSVRNLAAADGEELGIAFKSFDLVADKVTLRPETPEESRIELGLVRLVDPTLKLRITPPPAGSEAPPDSEATPPPAVRLARLEVTGGKADIEDRTVQPVYRSELSQLSVQGSGIRFPEGDAESLVVRAKGPGRGASVAIDAGIRDGNGQAKLVIKDLGLRALSPYAVSGAGYRLKRGKASVDADIAAKAGVYDIDSTIKLDKISVHEVNPGTFQDEFGMPLNTAIVLMRDRNGVISMPIKTKLEEGQTDLQVRTIMRGAMQQAIIAALSSPLKAAGLVMNVAGGDEFGLSSLDVPPGELPEIHADDLSGIAELLDARPEIAVALHGRAGPTDDPALKRQQLGDQVVADSQLPPVDAGFFQKRRLRGFLRKKESHEDTDLSEEDAAKLERWAEGVEISQESRDQLAVARAEAVRQALLTEFELDPARVVIGEPFDGAPGVELELLPHDDEPL